MNNNRSIARYAGKIVSAASCLVACGHAVAQTEAQNVDAFLKAARLYLSGPESTQQPPKGIAIKPLSPEVRNLGLLKERLAKVPEVGLTTGRSVSKKATTVSDRPGDAATDVAMERLQRVVRDTELSTVQLVTANFSVFEKMQLGDTALKFCEGNKPYCRTLRSSGWTAKRDGERRMSATLGAAFEKDPVGRALFVQRGDKVFGTISVGAESFLMRPLSNRHYAISAVRTDGIDRYKDDVLSLRKRPGAPKAPPPPKSVPKADAAKPAAPIQDFCKNPETSQVIDVLVTYTKRAENEAFKTSDDVLHLIDYAEELSNKSFKNSGINGQVNVVRKSVNSYVETGDFERDLKELLKPDGSLKSVREERKATKADVVVLVVDHPDPRNCGLAADIGVGKDKAYVVVNWKCVATKFSFIHEIGHLAGAWHDPDAVGNGFMVDPPYAYGYVTTGQRPLATIMAYRESCPVPCGRHWFWANPFTTTEDGQALGTIGQNYDACVLRQRLSVMARFDGG